VPGAPGTPACRCGPRTAPSVMPMSKLRARRMRRRRSERRACVALLALVVAVAVLTTLGRLSSVPAAGAGAEHSRSNFPTPSRPPIGWPKETSAATPTAPAAPTASQERNTRLTSCSATATSWQPPKAG
jgi:hypothetical protein